MKLKSIVLALSLSFVGTSAFAGAFGGTAEDLSPAGIETTPGAFAGTADIAAFLGGSSANGGLAALESATLTADDALIMQDGTNFGGTAFIEQSDNSTAGLNLAVIMQDSTTAAVPGNAAIYQLGAGNTAVIFQH